MTVDTAPRILDPVTHFNVAKSSYRVNEIRKTFFTHSQRLNELRVQKADSESVLYEFLTA
jgi:hypothetical protein